MLPTLVDGRLPPGVHVATVDEIAARFGCTPYREGLVRGFQRGCLSLRAAGCATVWLDGSFVTDKIRPGDFDACWDVRGVDLAKLDPVLLEFEHERQAQKAKYGGEFFPNFPEGASGLLFVDFFQQDKETGGIKGIVEVALAGVAP